MSNKDSHAWGHIQMCAIPYTLAWERPSSFCVNIIRRLFVTCCVFTRYFFVAFSWFFRGPLLSRKTVFGPFSWLFHGFFVAFSWLFRGPCFGQNLRVLALEQSSDINPQASAGSMGRVSSESWGGFTWRFPGVSVFRIVHRTWRLCGDLLDLSGTGDSQRDSRESIRMNHSQLKSLFHQPRNHPHHHFGS